MTEVIEASVADPVAAESTPDTASAGLATPVVTGDPTPEPAPSDGDAGGALPPVDVTPDAPPPAKPLPQGHIEVIEHVGAVENVVKGALKKVEALGTVIADDLRADFARMFEYLRHLVHLNGQQ